MGVELSNHILSYVSDGMGVKASWELPERVFGLEMLLDGSDRVCLLGLQSGTGYSYSTMCITFPKVL